MEDKNKKINSIFISGNSKYSNNNPDNHIYEHCCILIEINPVDNKVISVSHSSISILLTKIFANYLINNELDFGIKNTVTYIENNFYSPSKNAVIAALENITKKYKFLKKNNSLILNNNNEDSISQSKSEDIQSYNFKNILLNLDSFEIKEKLDDKNVKENELKYLVFQINSNHYAINIKYIEKVIKVNEITISSNKTEYVKGCYFKYKGKEIDVIDLRMETDSNKNNLNKNMSIIIINNNNFILGLFVDNIIDTINIPYNEIQRQNNHFLFSDQKLHTRGIYNNKNKKIEIIDINKTNFNNNYNT